MLSNVWVRKPGWKDRAGGEPGSSTASASSPGGTSHIPPSSQSAACVLLASLWLEIFWSTPGFVLMLCFGFSSFSSPGCLWRVAMRSCWLSAETGGSRAALTALLEPGILLPLSCCFVSLSSVRLERGYQSSRLRRHLTTVLSGAVLLFSVMCAGARPCQTPSPALPRPKALGLSPSLSS